jgi:hypothetical protein
MHSHLVQQRQHIVAVVFLSSPTLLYLLASQHACSDKTRQDCHALPGGGYVMLVS